MHTHHSIFDILIHSVEESLFLLPYLFITYLFLEFLEKKTERVSLFFSKTNSCFAPVLAALSGILPQCGLGVAGANLFAARVISVGTLIALFLATSDEMLPILLSNGVPARTIMLILFYKTSIAIFIGLTVDMVLKRKNKGKTPSFQMHTLCHQASCGCHQKSLWVSALNHTSQIFIFILVINMVLNILFLFVHPTHLKEILLNHALIAPLFGTLFGLIPNCATSVISAQLFAEKTLSDGAFLSAILANAGVGLLVLLRVNRPLKQSLKIIFFIFLIALLSGLIFSSLGLSF